MIDVATGASRTWLVTGALLGGLLSLFSLARALDAGVYLVYVATHGEPVDGWLALSVLEVVLALLGVTGMWRALAKRRLIAFVAFCLVQIPVPILIESMRF